MAVVGLGQAIVDVIGFCDHDALAASGLRHGQMTPLSRHSHRKILSLLDNHSALPGASVANTVADMASLGEATAFIGKVAADDQGTAFTRHLRYAGVRFLTPPASDSTAPTGRVIVLITPDGQRTMAAAPRVAGRLTASDVEEELIKATKLVLLEGYLAAMPEAQEAISRALNVAHRHSVPVALSLSDACLVAEQRSLFQDLASQAAVLIGNADELTALCGGRSLATAMQRAVTLSPTVVGTTGRHGASVLAGGELVSVLARVVPRVADTTGAGDGFAAGFLFGWIRRWPLHRAAQLGSFVAGEVIQQFGARPTSPLAGAAAALL